MIHFRDKNDWADWLDANHETWDGIWIKISKSNSAIGSVSLQEAIEVALCYGWVDGRKKSADEVSWLQHFGPRGIKSLWSVRSSKRAEELAKAGKMKPAGLRQIELAQKDGRWKGTYPEASQPKMPADLEAELSTRPQAQAFFEALDRRNRFAFMNRLESAKSPEARARRLAAYVELLEKGEKLYP